MQVVTSPPSSPATSEYTAKCFYQMFASLNNTFDWHNLQTTSSALQCDLLRNYVLWQPSWSHRQDNYYVGPNFWLSSSVNIVWPKVREGHISDDLTCLHSQRLGDNVVGLMGWRVGRPAKLVKCVCAQYHPKANPLTFFTNPPESVCLQDFEIGNVTNLCHQLRTTHPLRTFGCAFQPTHVGLYIKSDILYRHKVSNSYAHAVAHFIRWRLRSYTTPIITAPGVISNALFCTKHQQMWNIVYLSMRKCHTSSYIGNILL